MASVRSAYVCVESGRVAFVASSLDKAVQWCRDRGRDDVILYAADMNSEDVRQTDWHARPVTAEEYENKGVGSYPGSHWLKD